MTVSCRHDNLFDHVGYEYDTEFGVGLKYF